MLGELATTWLAKSWSSIAHLSSLESRIQVAAFAGPALCPLTVAGHRRGSYLLLEFEPLSSTTVDFWDHAKRSEFLDQLTTVRTVEQCYEFVVRWVFASAGYDRVMLYRFLKAWHGEVVREQCRPGVGRALVSILLVFAQMEREASSVQVSRIWRSSFRRRDI